MPKLKLLAVTVLTSFGPEDMAEQGYACPIAELVRCARRKAMEAGMDGIVASPLEAAAVRRHDREEQIAGNAGSAFGGRGKGRPEAGRPRRWKRCATAPTTW